MSIPVDANGVWPYPMLTFIAYRRERMGFPLLTQLFGQIFAGIFRQMAEGVDENIVRSRSEPPRRIPPPPELEPYGFHWKQQKASRANLHYWKDVVY